MTQPLNQDRLAALEQEPSATLFKSGDSAKVIMIGSDLPDGYTDVFAHPAPSGTNQVDELVMLVKRLAHSLKKANPDSKLHLDAMDYLKRNALIGITDLLRVSHPAPSIPPAVPEGYALVPVDATRAMIDAARRVEEDGYDAMHKAMIAAAPKGV
ncbi:hypothetical protein [Citrobacter braakii]|uniref:hypothetical protein n=1 Tax=Citrobacter braakii TaxID=57706 RepID=UPI0039B68F50